VPGLEAIAAGGTALDELARSYSSKRAVGEKVGMQRSMAVTAVGEAVVGREEHSPNDSVQGGVATGQSEDDWLAPRSSRMIVEGVATNKETRREWDAAMSLMSKLASKLNNCEIIPVQKFLDGAVKNLFKSGSEHALSKNQRKEQKNGVDSSRRGDVAEEAELGGTGRSEHEDGDTRRRRVRVSGAGQHSKATGADGSEQAAELRRSMDGDRMEEEEETEIEDEEERAPEVVSSTNGNNGGAGRGNRNVGRRGPTLKRAGAGSAGRLLADGGVRPGAGIVDGPCWNNYEGRMVNLKRKADTIRRVDQSFGTIIDNLPASLREQVVEAWPMDEEEEGDEDYEEEAEALF
jgi:hypothetical protein